MTCDFLNLAGKTIVVFGVANKKSVAFAIGKTLESAGAQVLYVVKDTGVRDKVRKLLGSETPILTCDVTKDAEIDELHGKLRQVAPEVHGMVHSIANAAYSDGFGPFHQTKRQDFLAAVNVSAFSLIALANTLSDLLVNNSSIVTISISTTRMAAENYGYMAPVKAALDSSVVFLAKSLSRGRNIRVNAVGAGLLKTSASAAIPGYVDSYLYAEHITPRGHNVTTQEVADAAVFLLSERAGGINGQTIVVDAGMGMNYFDQEVVKSVVASPVTKKEN